jgi:hypothetical protein
MTRLFISLSTALLFLLLPITGAHARDSITIWLSTDKSPCVSHAFTEPLHRLIATRLLKKADPIPNRPGSLRKDTLKKVIDLRKKKKKKVKSKVKRTSDHLYAVLNGGRSFTAKLTKKNTASFDFLVCTYEYSSLKSADYRSLSDNWKGKEARSPYVKLIKKSPKKGSAKISVPRKKGAKRISIIAIRGGFHDGKSGYTLELKRP